jgi:hypothetical protein
MRAVVRLLTQAPAIIRMQERISCALSFAC